MRMNRGTIFLIAGLLVILVVVMLVSNNQASAPGTTPTPVEATGPLFADLVAGNITRYEVRDNVAGTFTALTQDTGGAWHIDGTNTLAGRDPDQSLIETTAGQIASIQYNNTFTDDKLDTFGLASPSYTVFITTDSGFAYTIYVGAKAPTSSRYYAVVQKVAIAASTAEPAAIATENITGPNANESGVVPATAESTAEATAAPASKRIFHAQAATEEATAVSEAAATATVEAMTEATAEATAAVTMEATAEMTMEATPEATANVIAAPGVTLTGQQTIYVIPQTVIDTLKRWLTTPPYAPVPTALPTIEFTPEVTTPPLLEATTASEATPPAEATSAATMEPTTEATAEATAAS